MVEVPTQTTQERPRTPVSNQNRAKPPKSLVLSEDSTDLRASTTYGTTFDYATHSEREIAQTVDPRHLPTARSRSPAGSGKKKSAVYDSKPRTESPAPTTIVPALETRSDTAVFVEKHQKTEKTVYFTPKPPDSPISTRFNWSDDAYEPPTLSTTPTKRPRDISCLRSSSENPFLSLRRRHRQPRNSHRFTNWWSLPNCQHTLPNPHCHIPASRTPHQSSQLHLPVSLDWDQDPRLLDLSNALKALGWVRR
jgi:hypothetical protein